MHLSRLSLRFVFLLATAIAAAANSATADDSSSSSNQEQSLLAVLSSDAPAAEKAIACKKLAIYGSSGAVADLAKLLPDPQLSSWARIALEAIPGDEADEALREASDSLEGRLLVGVINSIGVRRDTNATESLTARLADSDSEVASAAAVALGTIGNEAAKEALQRALAAAPAGVRDAVAEGYVLVAERLHADGDSDAAAEVYDEIRSADVSSQRIVEATRGAILARGQDGIPLLLETFRSPDEKLFQLALGTIREFPGGEVDRALAKEIDGASPQRAALLIQAMADRPDTVVLASILEAAEQGDKQVRLSAIDALRQVGDVSCLPALMEIAAESDAELAQAAHQSLAGLPGDDVDSRIVAILPTAKEKGYQLLIELVGERRIAAVPDLLKALNDSDPAIRAAALTSLGETVPLDRLSLLVSQVVAPKYAEDAPIAAQALKVASVRMPDREACAAELAAALQSSSAATKTTLLEILADVGGTNALQTLASAANSEDPELQDTGSRLLGKWNSVDAAPVLLDLAKSGPASKYQVRALRGYIGLARKFAMPDQQRAEMCRQAMQAAQRTDERKLVLEVLQLHPSIDGLKLALAAKQVPAIEDDASAAARAIAQKLRRKGVDVSNLMSGS
jgi:HEAT repeat protein